MFLKMRVLYEGQEMVYDMPVGDGRMTIKWLGLAAAQRFSASIKPRGYRRHREKARPINITSTFANLLPCRVYTKESTFLHPDKPVYRELTDGNDVFVVLANKMPVNHTGRPMRDRWMFIAFNISEQNEPEREKAIEGEYRAMDDTRAQLQRDEEVRAANLAAKKGAQMRRVMLSQLYCQEKVELAFERDWTKLCHPVMQPLDKLTEDLEEQSQIKKAVLAHYVTLVEVFRHYASVGSGVATGELDLMEFSAFMHDMRGFSAAKSRDLVEKSFIDAVSACRGEKARTTSGTVGTMGVAEFIFCVIRLACIRHHVSSNTSVAGGAGNVADSSAPSSKIKWAGSVCEAVVLFMEGIMVPLAQRKVIGLQIKNALDSNEILALYYDNDEALRLIFEKYRNADDNGGGHAAHSVFLSIAEFGLILRHAGLLGGNNKEDDELTVKEARQAFAGAQDDLCGGDTDTYPPLEAGSPIEQMTYAEFLEGVARVAMLKWEDASSPPKGKIERAVQAVTALLRP